MKINFRTSITEIKIEFNEFLLNVFEEAQAVANATGQSQIVYIAENDFAFSSKGYFLSLKPRPRKIAQIFPAK